MEELTLNKSKELIDKAIKRAEYLKVEMSFAVVDNGGNTIVSERMDGALFPTLKIAEGKAFTSAAWRKPSREIIKRFKDNLGFAMSVNGMYQGRFTLGNGAFPIIKNGKLLGAMGASGGTGEQDEECVKYALEE
jgi:uncharacterized protein GlcG (DUF336 family)